MGSASPKQPLSSGAPTCHPAAASENAAALGRYIGRVRGRIALRRLLATLLAAVAVAVGLVLLWLAGGSAVGGASRWVGTLLPVISGGLLLAGVSGWLATLIRRSTGPVVRRVARRDPRLAEGLKSALELGRDGASVGGLERAFTHCHAASVARQLRTLPEVEVVPLTRLGRAGWMVVGLAALAGLGIALVPGAPGRLAAVVGISSAHDRLPVVLRGSGVERVRMVIRPPRYTGLPLDAVMVGDKPVTVPLGSRVTVVARTPVPLSAARGLLSDGRVVGGTLLGERIFRVELVARADGDLAFSYRSRKGIGYVGEVGPAFRVGADLKPDIRVRPADPQIAMERPRVLPLRWEVTDDYGVVEARLLWRTDLGDEGALVLGRGPRFGKQRKQRLAGVLKWDLTRLRLGVGQRVTFHVEARDNRSDAAGGNRTESPPQTVIIRGAKPPAEKVLSQLRAILERAVSLLGDRLIDPSITDCVRRMTRLRRRGPPQTRLLRLLDKVLSRARDTELPTTLRAVLTGRLARHRRTLATLQGQEHRALRRGPTGCPLVKRLAPLEGRLLKGYEDLVLELDALVGRATLERMQQLSKQIERLQREIEQLTKQNRRTPSKELKRRIAKRLAKLRRLFKKLGGLWSSLQDEAIDKHVNRYALDRKQTDKLLRRMSSQSRGGKTSSADLKELQRRVSRLRRALDRGLDSFRQFYRIPGERRLRRSERGVRQLARDQAALDRQAGKRPADEAGKQAGLGRRARRLAEELKRAPGGTAASKLLESAAEMMRRAAEAMQKGGAAQSERKAAREALDGAARELDRQGRVNPDAGADGDRDRIDGDVAIPPAGGALPRELRKLILEGGRTTWPRQYRGPLKRYYDRLLR